MYSQTAYSTRDTIYKILRKVFALPLLPAEDIPDAFVELKRKVNADADAMVTFLEYVEATWIESEIWPVSSWSVYGRSIRTNNDVEGWHHRLNRRAKKGNLPFYLLIVLLYSKANDLPTQCQLVREGKLVRHQSKRTQYTQGRLMALWKLYNEKRITTNHLLKRCGRIYGPC